MAALEELQAILNSLDITQLAIILSLAGLLLIFLIFLTVKRRNREDDISVSEMQQYRRSHEIGSTKVQSQARVSVSEPVDSSELNRAQNSNDAEVQRPVVNQVDVRAEAVTQVAETPKLPEDSVLRRHYFANEAAKEEILHDPYPTDSVLRRHYDTAHKIGNAGDIGSVELGIPEPSLPQDSCQERDEQIPEDSVLRRHYLANKAATELALHEPYPSDSVLQRHYDTEHRLIDDSSAVDARSVAPAAQTNVSGSSQKYSIIEKAVDKSEPAKTVNASPKCEIPQDSILKRHFISQLRAEIETNMAVRPTDSVLRRHYESLVGAELEKRLCS